MATYALTITNNAKMGDMLQQLLASVSIQVVLKDTLQLAAQYLGTESLPHLVIIDWSLPENLKSRFLQGMKASKRFGELPVLVIVESPDSYAIRVALQAGANRYLTQSFIHTNLLPTLREMQVASL
jgi:DNA-binding response OmpR family regulator